MMNILKLISAATLVAAVVVAPLSERQSAEAHDDGASRSVLRAMAHDGNSQAAFELGLLAGEQTRARIHWFAEAAEQGHVGAMCELAQIYDGGHYGALIDILAAEYWYDSVLEIQYQAKVDEWEKATSTDESLTFQPKRFGGSTEAILSAGRQTCDALRMSRWMMDMEAYY